MTTRRDFLKQTSLIAAAGVVSSNIVNAAINGTPAEGTEAYKLADLPYKYEALEPVIDTLTMQIHHDKHHAKYVSNLNDLAKELKWEKYPALDELMISISKYPMGVRNNGGGHYNHTMFWTLMTPGGAKAPEGKLADAINTSFTSLDEFKKQFSAAAASRFGSGWAWLIINNEGKLQIGSTANQDNPLMDISELKGTPLLALDVWEHAYYLKYQNKRADYITNWWNVVNWNEVAKRLV